MKGLIFSVKRYSVHDGPGIRVTFFMKGCPLSCWWCHNPEGLSPEPEEITDIKKIGEKEFHRRTVAGKYYNVEDIISILDRDKIFIEHSGGGVTFSGGEPLMQPEFLSETLKACRTEGYHTAVDTSGHFPSELLEKVLPYTSLFLYDLKHLDPEQHLKYTGFTNKLIIKNLELLVRSDVDIMLRIPIIPGINDDDKHLAVLRNYINKIKNGRIKMINLLPYHKTGASKYRLFNRQDRMKDFQMPLAEKMDELKKFFAATGIKVKAGG
ncbi:MAG: glycyl-radical enzyme activating protein [Bacteroidales bacterium]